MAKKKNREKTFVPIGTQFLKGLDLTEMSSLYPVVNVLQASDVQSELASIKKLTEAVKKEECKNSGGESVIKLILIPLYVKAQLKNPIKKVVSSCLQSLNENYGDAIKSALAGCLQEAIRNIFTNSSNDDLDETQLRKPIVENLFSCLDNFPLGEEALMLLYPEALQYLQTTLETQQQHVSRSTSPATVSHIVQLSLVSVQVFNKLMQRGASHKSSSANTNDSRLEAILKDMYMTAVNILKSDNAVLDVRVNCAMCLPLILRHIFNDLAINKLYTSFHPAESQLEHTCDFPPVLLKVNLPVISYMCLINGILAILVMEELLKSLSAGKVFLVDVVGAELQHLLDSVNDSTSKLMVSRTFVLYTSKCSEALDLSSHPEHQNLCESLQGNSPLLQQMIHYAWDHWEDHTDAVRHQARLIFENCISCHVKAVKQDAKCNAFLSQLVDSLLQAGLHSKGIYGPLCCLVGHMGVKSILKTRPHLINELLSVMGEQAMASYVSEFYEKMFTVDKQEYIDPEGKLSNEHLQLWQKDWVDPVLHALCTGTNSRQKNVMEYIVPKLLKTFPDLVVYIGKTLASDKSDQANKLGALVTCLRRAKALGVLNKSSADVSMWNGVVPVDVIKQALGHQNEQIRLDAIGMLCEHPKNTEAVSEVDLMLIEQYLGYSLSSQTPAFRQHLIAFVKKLMVRLKDSGTAIIRKLEVSEKKNEDSTQFKHCLKAYQSFLGNICNQLYKLLHPCAAFPSRTTAAAMLNLIASIFTPSDKNVLEFQFLDTVDSHVAQTLLESLTDTFEQNKTEVFSVLKSLPVEKLYLDNPNRLEQLYQACLQLSTSTRPQDCTTAAYLFRVLLCVPQLYSVSFKQLSKLDRYEKVTNDMNGRYLLLVALLLEELRSEVDVAKSSLLHTAATKPMYPVLHCIRYLLADLTFKTLDNPDQWRSVLGEVITTCFEVAEVVSPVVTNSSPEGNVCVEQNILGPGLAIDAVLQTDTDKKSPTTHNQQQQLEESATKVNLMPEYLIVCCWRSIKEVSLLLGQLSQTLPVVESDVEKGLVTVKQLMSVGDYFITQLLESIHRGAFELAYAGFVKMTEMMWMSPVEALLSQPKKWLEEVLDDVVNPDSKLCATRRSAGVPFYVQAIISMEPASCGYRSLQWIMGKLLPLAKPVEGQTEGDTENTAQVHSLNILRALFRDTRLSDEVFPYIAEGFQAAILGYSSKFWAVRNSASLLFSALMVRIFGVKRSKETSSRKDSGSKKNCMTGRVFFQKFPSLYTFLLQQMATATQNMGCSGEFHLHPGLYPVLMVLGRLYPSTTELSNASMNLAAFVPHVIRCGSSPVYKTRMMAARAIQPLVSKDHLTEVITQLLTQVTQPHCLHNYKHGALLQVNSLLESVKCLSLDDKIKVKVPILQLLRQSCEQLQSSHTPCFPIQTVLFEVVFKALNLFSNTGPENQGQINWLESILQNQNVAHKNEKSTVNIWYSEFQKVFAESYLRYLHHCCETSAELGNKFVYYSKVEQYLLQTVNSDEYDVQLAALEFMLEVCNEESDCINSVSTSDSLAAKIMESGEILKMLITLTWNEDLYPECLALTLECLCKHKLASNVPWIGRDEKQSYRAEAVWSRLLVLTTHSLDEVRCAALQLLGTILQQVCTASGQTNVLNEFCNLLEERCDTQQSVESRHVVAGVIVENVNLLLLDSSAQLGKSVLSQWTIVLRLLQDEDCDVRSKMSGMLPQLSSFFSLPQETVHNPIEPSLAVECCLKVIVQAFISRFPVELFSSLMFWIEEDLEPAWETEDKEVRLFDKGEMNTYRDELSIVYTVQKYSKLLLSSLFGNSKKQENLSFNNLEKLDSSNLHSIEEFISSKYHSLCSEIEARLDWVNPISVADPYLKQEEYKMDIMYTARKLTALDVVVHGMICCGSEKQEMDVSEKLVQLKTKYGEKFRNKNTLMNNVVYNLIS